MNREIEINKFDNRLTFINRGIAFSRIGVDNEILNLIDDLLQENKQLKQQKKQAINFIKNYMYENYCYCGSEDKLLEILGGKENE